MKIVFVQPDGSGNPHLGLMYLAGVLKKEGYQDIHHVSLLPPEYGNVEKRTKDYLISLLGQKPDVVGVTSTTPSWGEAVKICKLAKEYDSTVIVGGPGPSLLREKILEQYPFIDIVNYGEADNTIGHLIKCIEQGSSLNGIKGVIYRENGKIIQNEPNPLIMDLDSIPYPDRDALNLWSYHTPFSILTSRGCPYACLYCSKPVHGSKWRARTPKNVVDEIEFLLDRYPDIARKVKNKISINDDIFNFDINRAKQICNEIIQRKLDIEIVCANGLHVRTVDYELFEKMKKAGCSEIWFGVESGNPEVLKRVGKGINLQMVKDAVRLAKKAGVKTIGAHFIIGLPYENIGTARDSIRFARELGVDVAGFGYANALPGTKLYEWVMKNGKMLLEHDEFDRFKPNIAPTFETPEFSKSDRELAYSEAIKLIDELYRRKALRPDEFINFITSLRSIEDLKWAGNKIYAYLFKKDLRYGYSDFKPSTIKK